MGRFGRSVKRMKINGAMKEALVGEGCGKDAEGKPERSLCFKVRRTDLASVSCSC